MFYMGQMGRQYHLQTLEGIQQRLLENLEAMYFVISTKMFYMGPMGREYQAGVLEGIH
jgi:hypothetical protein